MLIPAPSAALALSSLHSLSSHYFLLPSHSLPPSPPLRRGDLAIRMGGGPRTYPGGVSKWQWKRMQAKKARQLLKARLARERQLYEMRKRTELRDAVAHLERPWDPDTSADASAVAPNLLSVAADDQLRALADRFHRPGGVDLWNDRDGPRVFASPATGAASARFFPKNAVHSVQPYALVGDGGEASAPRAWGDNAAGLLQLGLGDSGAQGVRENATEDEAYHPGDDEPAVELRERDGTWEPVNTLDDGDDSIPGYWSSDDDSDIVPSELEDMGDVRPRHVPRAMMLRRNGRNNGMPRWDVAGTMAAGSVDDSGWSGDTFFSDPERAREGPRERRWQERSSGASTRKRAGGRRSDLNTIASSHAGQRGRIGSASFSDSEVIHGGSERKWRPRTRDDYGDGTGRANEPKWRPRTRDDNGNGVGRANEPKWRPRSRDDNGNGVGRWNAPRQDRISVEFKSNSDTARGGTEPRWGARNKFNGRENLGRSKPKYSTTTSDGDAWGRQMRFNNGDEHENSSNGDRRYRFGGGFAEDLEAPTWKPRRMNRARNNNGDGRTDSVSGRFRRGDNARRLQESPRSTNREDGQRMNSYGGQRFRGADYSLRPTSELHSGSSGEM